MSFIPCTEHCVYQSDGNCELERAASSGNQSDDSDKCAHFIEKPASTKT